MDYMSIQLVLLALQFVLVAGIAIVVPQLWKGMVFLPERGRQETGQVLARCRDAFIPIGALLAIVMAESFLSAFLAGYMPQSPESPLWTFASLYLLILFIGLAVLLGIQGRETLAPSVSVISGLFRDVLLALAFVVFIVLAVFSWLFAGTLVTAVVLLLGVIFLSTLYFIRARSLRDGGAGDDWVI